MRQALLALASLAAVATLFAQAPAPAPDKPREQTPALCTVSGRVVTAADGTPLKSARVILGQEHEGRHSRNYAARSDSDGHFTLKGILPGRYKFFALHNGYVDQEYKANGVNGGAVLALHPGEQLADVLFRLTMAAVITGRVTGEDGAALVHLRLLAMYKPTDEEVIEEDLSESQRQEPSWASAAYTDDRGQYRIFGLKPGEYYVQATDSLEPDHDFIAGREALAQEFLGSDYAPVYYPGVTQFSQAQSIALGAGEEGQIDLVMRQVKTVEVSGRVIGPDGNPAADASVNLYDSGDVPGTDRDTSTDAKGAFNLKGVPPGSYFVFAFLSGQDGRQYRARQKLEVGNDNIDSIVIAMGGGTTFSGRITVAGPGAIRRDRIFIVATDVGDGRSWGDGASVKKDGTFEFVDLREGNYAVSVRIPEEGWYTKSVRLGPEDVLTTGLQVEKGSSGGTIEIVLTGETAQLEGSVSEDDKPAGGAHVRVTPDPKTAYNETLSRSVSTDQLGHFLLNLAPGKYRVAAKSLDETTGTAVSSDPRAVSLSEHERKTIDLTIAHQTK